MKKQDKQYFIRLNKQYILVTEEVYKVLSPYTGDTESNIKAAQK